MKSILASLAVVLSLTACNVSGTSSGVVPGDAAGALRDKQDFLGGTPAIRTPVSLALFDAPLTGMPGVKVNVALAGAQLLTNGGAVPFITYGTPNVVDLIALQKNPLMLNGYAPNGSYTGVRLLIESAQSNVTFGNMTIPIVWGTPGHPTTSPVIAVDFSVQFAAGGSPSGKTTTVTLDFNVMQSVRFANGMIYVQPSVTAANAAGEVDGTVKNAAGKPVSNASVLAMSATGHLVNATATAADGTYALHALPPGAYTIVVKNSYVTASGETITASGNDAGAAPSKFVVLSPEDKLQLDTLVD